MHTFCSFFFNELYLLDNLKHLYDTDFGSRGSSALNQELGYRSGFPATEI